MAPDGVFDAGYCHCSMCRRLTGAPLVAWASLRAEAFRLVSGEVRYYYSSLQCRRGFCPVCGGQLFYDGPGMPGLCGIHTATLDRPAPPALRPRLHMCFADRLPWLALGEDGLPRFADNRLSHPDKR
ncbi:MAG: hypothetical protein B7X08_06200 [Acidocella sp. 20-63-7]|nr:MAG: hypothetical protein B7X08_06200 [Acidocella sp. 20-63-7]